MKNKLYVSSSPHFRGEDSTAIIMGDVLLALVPAVMAATYFFGYRVLLVVSFCIASCVVLEFLSRKAMKRDVTVGDLSAVVTGALLALSLPADINLFYAFFGCVVAIVVAKQFFGGIGQNFVNPAITARVAMVVSFPTAMATWPAAREIGRALTPLTDGITGATPLDGVVTGGEQISYLDMFLGNNVGGSMGETCAWAILIGFAYLLMRRVIKPIIPVAFVGTVALLSYVLGADPWFQVLAGGVLFVAVFMATDYATSPLTNKGKVIFGVGCGVITVLIRLYGSLPEGVSYAVLIMNVLTPYIDRKTITKTFGKKKAV